MCTAIEQESASSISRYWLRVVDDSSPNDTRAIAKRYDDLRLIDMRNQHNLASQGNGNGYLELSPRQNCYRPETILILNVGLTRMTPDTTQSRVQQQNGGVASAPTPRQLCDYCEFSQATVLPET